MKKISSSLEQLTFWLAMIVLVWLYYGESVRFYFVSDDFPLIERGLWRLPQLFEYSQGSHWIPFSNLFFHMAYQLFGMHHQSWHLASMGLHIINALLVTILAAEMFRDKFTASLSAVLFLTFAMNYEAVIWITGICNLLMASMYLLTMICFNEYLKKQNPWMLLVTGFFMLLALLTIESSIFLIVMLFAWELLVHNQNNNLSFSHYLRDLRQSGGKYLFLAAVVVLFLSVRLSLLNVELLSHPSVPSFDGILVNYARAGVYLFFPFLPSLALQVWPGNILPVLGSFLLIAFLAVWKWRHCRFPIAAIIISLTPTLLLAIIQARYLYLPSAFYSILLAAAIAGLANSVSIAGGRSRALAAAPYINLSVVVLACFPLLFMQKRMLERRMSEWRRASGLSAEIDSFLRTKYETVDMLPENTLILVNLPDGVPSDEVWPAYVARVGTRERLNLIFGEMIGRLQAYNIPAEMATAFSPLDVLFNAPRIDTQKLRQLCANGSNDIYIWDPVNEQFRDYCG